MSEQASERASRVSKERCLDWSLLGFPAERLLTLCRSPRVECLCSDDVVGGKTPHRSGVSWIGQSVTCLAAPGACSGEDRREYYSPPSSTTTPHRSRVRGRLRSASIVAVGVAVRWQLAPPLWASSLSPFAGKCTLFYPPEAPSLSLSSVSFVLSRSAANSPLTSPSFFSSSHFPRSLSFYSSSRFILRA